MSSLPPQRGTSAGFTTTPSSPVVPKSPLRSNGASVAATGATSKSAAFSSAGCSANALNETLLEKKKRASSTSPVSLSLSSSSSTSSISSSTSTTSTRTRATTSTTMSSFSGNVTSSASSSTTSMTTRRSVRSVLPLRSVNTSSATTSSLSSASFSSSSTSISATRSLDGITDSTSDHHVHYSACTTRSSSATPLTSSKSTQPVAVRCVSTRSASRTTSSNASPTLPDIAASHSPEKPEMRHLVKSFRRLMSPVAPVKTKSASPASSALLPDQKDRAPPAEEAREKSCTDASTRKSSLLTSPRGRNASVKKLESKNKDLAEFSTSPPKSNTLLRNVPVTSASDPLLSPRRKSSRLQGTAQLQQSPSSISPPLVDDSLEASVLLSPNTCSKTTSRSNRALVSSSSTVTSSAALRKASMGKRSRVPTATSSMMTEGSRGGSEETNPFMVSCNADDPTIASSEFAEATSSSRSSLSSLQPPKKKSEIHTPSPSGFRHTKTLLSGTAPVAIPTATTTTVTSDSSVSVAQDRSAPPADDAFSKLITSSPRRGATTTTPFSSSLPSATPSSKGLDSHISRSIVQTKTSSTTLLRQVLETNAVSGRGKPVSSTVEQSSPFPSVEIHQEDANARDTASAVAAATTSPSLPNATDARDGDTIAPDHTPSAPARKPPPIHEPSLSGSSLFSPTFQPTTVPHPPHLPPIPHHHLHHHHHHHHHLSQGLSVDESSDTLVLPDAGGLVLEKDVETESFLYEQEVAFWKPFVVNAKLEDLEQEDELYEAVTFIATLPKRNLLADTSFYLDRLGGPGKTVSLLPAKEPGSPPLTLVLDLDETLVHCTVGTMEPCDLTFPLTLPGSSSTLKVSVRWRPYLFQFLEGIRNKFEVVVFTASQQIYADTLLNIMEPDASNRAIKYRLFRDSCTWVNGNFVKDLTNLGRELQKTIIVDNAPQAYGYHIQNGYAIPSWYDDPNDRSLLDLLDFLHGVAARFDHSHPPRGIVAKGPREVPFSSHSTVTSGSSSQKKKYKRIVDVRKLLRRKFPLYTYVRQYKSDILGYDSDSSCLSSESDMELPSSTSTSPSRRAGDKHFLEQQRQEHEDDLLVFMDASATLQAIPGSAMDEDDADDTWMLAES